LKRGDSGTGQKKSESFSYKNKVFYIYPTHYDSAPVILSSFTASQGRTFIISSTAGNKFILIPVTLETGQGKLNQTHVFLLTVVLVKLKSPKRDIILIQALKESSWMIRNYAAVALKAPFS